MSETSDLIAVIETGKGEIHLKLYGDKAPLTVANFVNLARREYYKDMAFHRVLSDFMIQGGCPRGDGTGGPGYQFQDEFDPELRHDRPGILSMANAGPNTNGSQFFITHVGTPWLDQKHTVFGAVIDEKDQEVVNRIAQDDKIHNITIQGNVSELMTRTQSQVDQWNKVLDQQ